MEIKTKLCVCESGIELRLIDVKIEEDIPPLLMRIKRQKLYSSSNKPIPPYNCGIIFIGDDDEQSRKEIENILRENYSSYKKIFYKKDLPKIPHFEDSSDRSLTQYIHTLAEEIAGFINAKFQAKPTEGQAYIWHIKDSRLCQVVSEIVRSIVDSQNLINFAIYHVLSGEEQKLHEQKNLLESACIKVGEVENLSEEHKSKVVKVLYKTYLKTLRFPIREALQVTRENVNHIKAYLEEIERTHELQERDRKKLRNIIQTLSQI